MKKEFNLRYENYAGDLGYKGTIRTTPEGYYVCSIKEGGELEFRGLEVITRNINKARVKEWWKWENETDITKRLERKGIE